MPPKPSSRRSVTAGGLGRLSGWGPLSVARHHTRGELEAAQENFRVKGKGVFFFSLEKAKVQGFSLAGGFAHEKAAELNATTKRTQVRVL